MMAGSNAICATSTWPLRPLQTCSYVGLGTRPPMYPDTTAWTPSNCWKAASTHQKHPPPRIAVSVLGMFDKMRERATRCECFERSAQLLRDLREAVSKLA